MPQSLSLRDVVSGPARFRAITAWDPISGLLALAAMALVIVALQVTAFWLAGKLLGAEAFNAQIVETGLAAPLMLLAYLAAAAPATV